jgi:hypothetical protein
MLQVGATGIKIDKKNIVFQHDIVCELFIIGSVNTIPVKSCMITHPSHNTTRNKCYYMRKQIHTVIQQLPKMLIINKCLR